MARRPNYGYEKRQKELKKKAKRAAKLARSRGGDGSGPEIVAPPDETGTGGDPTPEAEAPDAGPPEAEAPDADAT